MRISVILGYALCSGFLVGLFSILVDFDHIWAFYGLTEPFNLTGIYGRPFHVWYLFTAWALLYTCGIFALVARLVQSNTMVDTMKSKKRQKQQQRRKQRAKVRAKQ